MLINHKHILISSQGCAWKAQTGAAASNFHLKAQNAHGHVLIDIKKKDPGLVPKRHCGFLTNANSETIICLRWPFLNYVALKQEKMMWFAFSAEESAAEKVRLNGTACYTMYMRLGKRWIDKNILLVLKPNTHM